MNHYSETVQRWAVDMRRAGVLPDADGTGEVGLESERAGNRLAARFTLKVESGRVADVRYQVFGCGFSMAACAVAADLAVGDALEEVERIDAQRLDAALDGLPADRSYCADLAVQALQAAVLSARNGRPLETSALQEDTEHGSRISCDDPIYAALVACPCPEQSVPEDRHLFACLVAVAAGETPEVATALGLADTELEEILDLCFPGFPREYLARSAMVPQRTPPRANEDVLAVLQNYLPADREGGAAQLSAWLVKIIATRAALPGHLWVAMGLTERPQLSAAIGRHLPELSAANQHNMRWKRFLYKQVCDLNGGTMCKAPNCGVCSDYALCFAE